MTDGADRVTSPAGFLPARSVGHYGVFPSLITVVALSVSPHSIAFAVCVCVCFHTLVRSDLSSENRIEVRTMSHPLYP